MTFRPRVKQHIVRIAFAGLLGVLPFSALASDPGVALSDDALSAMLSLRTQKVSEAQATAERACTAGDVSSCAISGMIHSAEKYGVVNQALARLRFGQGCDGKFWDACPPAIQMTYEGYGGAVDKPGALRRAEAACAAGNAESCDWKSRIETDLNMPTVPELPQAWVEATPKPARPLSVKPKPVPPIKAAPSQPARPEMNLASPVVQHFQKTSISFNKACRFSLRDTREKLKTTLVACNEIANREMQRAGALPGKLTKTQIDEVELQVAMAMMEQAILFQFLIDAGHMPQSNRDMACSGLNLIRKLLNNSSDLERGDLSLFYTMTRTRLELAQPFCQ